MRSRRNGYRTPLPALAILLAAVSCVATGCFNRESKPDSNSLATPTGGMEVVTVAESVRVVGTTLTLRAARNEWADGYVRLGNLGNRPAKLKIPPLTRKDGSSAGTIDGFKAYRVESLSVDPRSVETVRAVGPTLGAPGPAATPKLARALIPLEFKDDAFEVPPGTDLVYLEVKPGIEVESADYTGALELSDVPAGPRRLPIAMRVDDLTLSETSSFVFVGDINWPDLVRVWPQEFGGTVARLVSRRDPKQVLAVERLDEMVRLARENRVSVSFLGLAPTIKNSPREGLRVDWSDYDSLVIPWLRGEIDRAGEGMAAFPLPTSETAAGLNSKEYWATVTGHFDQERLLGHMIAGETVPFSDLPALAQERVRRIAIRSSGAVVTGETYRQATWSALASGVFAATARGVAPAGSSPSDTVDAANPAWFYPGEWFGTRQVVPGVALKWARRAQQDYEILDLARRRGAKALSVGIADRITRASLTGPSTASPAATREGGLDLLTPAVDPTMWDEALRLAREAALARVPGASEPTESEKQALATSEDDALSRWSVVLQRPLALPVGITYTASIESGSSTTARIPFALELALPERGSEAAIENIPKAWEETGVQLRQGGATLRGILELSHLIPPYRDRLVVEAVAGPDRLRTKREIIVPAIHVLPSPKPPVLDGQLGDWAENELIARKEMDPEFAARSGLVRMLDRRSVQLSVTTRSPKDAQLFARWDPDALWLACRLDGVADVAATATNFTREIEGRACGEDLCRIVLNSVGAGRDREIRLLAKPAGLTLEQAPPDQRAADRVLYASSIKEGVWRLEMRIPAALLGHDLKDGSALEFNLIRHDAATGETASWAGPIDADYSGVRGLLIIAEKLPRPKAP